MKYDYVISNGTLVDFERMQTQIGTVYVKGGRIAPPPEHGFEFETAQTIDADGKYVLPGLIDEHAHFNYDGSNIGANADLICPPAGVTTAVDGGTAGPANFELFQKANISRYVTSIKAYVNLSPYGVHSSYLHEEDLDPADFNEEQLIALFEKYPKTIRGLKIRMCKATLGNYGITPLTRAVNIAEKIRTLGHHCPIAMHFSDLPEDVSLAALLEQLRPGDIFTHVFQNKGETIFDERMRVKECVRNARDRGVLFDTCNGRIHWSFKNMRAAVGEGFLPDIISSDIIRESAFLFPSFSLTHAMCTLLAIGMDELSILKAVTYSPAKALGLLGEAGTLNVGAPADIAVLDVASNEREFIDRFGGTVIPDRVFLPLLTIRAGEPVFRQIFF